MKVRKQYRAHYSSYFESLIVVHCLQFIGSDSGMMGGKVAHEYMYLSPIGEDTIIICDNCGYTANRQVATFKKEYYKEEEKQIEEVHTPSTTTIEELAKFLNIEKRQTAKALFMMGTFVDENSGEEEQKLYYLTWRFRY